MNTLRRCALRAGLALSTLALLHSFPVHAEVDDEGAYSYLRTLEGDVSLEPGDGTESFAAQINQPVLSGDVLRTERGSRAEVVLADGNFLRIAGSSEVRLISVAGERDSRRRDTRIELADGEIQLVVQEDALGRELPRVDTGNATLYVERPGVYVLRSDRWEYSEIVVRDGRGEVLAEGGSCFVRRGEQAVVEGRSGARATVERAAELSSLERWASRLDEDLAYADHETDDLDGSLRYSAHSLDRHGVWISIGHRRVWRPTVTAGWRPYHDGYWRPSPSGLLWVSNEPWGWVPYHYGTWDYVSGHGWVWYPGHVFAPAWVYWYWSPSHVGWCPVGYYTNHYYSRYRHGFHSGVYGWSHNDWRAFEHWNFVPANRLGYRDQARHTRPSHELRGEGRDGRLPRGLITTDTRGITPTVIDKPEEAIRILETRPAARPGRGGDLPDVTPFISRGDLPEDVRVQVLETKPEEGREATPLRPIENGTRPPRPVRTEKPADEDGSGGRPALGRRPYEAPPRVEPSETPTVISRPAPRPPRTEKPEESSGSSGDSRRPVVKEPEADAPPTVVRRPRPVPEAEKPAEKPAEEGSSGENVRIHRRPAPQAPPPSPAPQQPEVMRQPRPSYQPPPPPPPTPPSEKPAEIRRRPAPAPPERPAEVKPAEPKEVQPSPPPPTSSSESGKEHRRRAEPRPPNG